MGEERPIRQREPLPTRVDGLPDLPDAYVGALEPTLAALAAGGFAIDAQARGVIDGHLRLLLAWNAAINLTAITDPAAMARLHVADSLAALPLIDGLRHRSILDLGSGGGFPGIPLAACLPEARLTLTESVAKKAAFLDVVLTATGLGDRAVVVNARAEALVPGPWDVVTARAVGSLATLVELALPLLAIGGHLLAWKRGELAGELAAAGRAAAVLGGAEPAVVAHPEALARAAGIEGHCIVMVRKAGPTPAGYPRDPAVRARRAC